jgi:hypothetical protein
MGITYTMGAPALCPVKSRTCAAFPVAGRDPRHARGVAHAACPARGTRGGACGGARTLWLVVAKPPFGVRYKDEMRRMCRIWCASMARF